MAQKQGGGQPGGSMHEGLQGILGMIGPLMVAPDADVQFLNQLQQVIVGRLKASTQHAIQGGGQPGPGGNQIAPGGGAGPAGLHSGGMTGGPGGPGAGAPPGPGGGGGGAPLGGANPDELQRVLGSAGGQG